MEIQEYIDKGLIHSIHTSERRAFRGCRRRWDWAYRQNYHPTVTPAPLEFGTAYHVAMETYYNPDTWAEDNWTKSRNAIDAFKDTVQDQYSRYIELNGRPEDDVIERYKHSLSLGIDMVKYYTTKISPKIDQGLTPLAVEIPFEVSLGFNCGCEACKVRWKTSSDGIAHHDKWQEETYQYFINKGREPDKARQFCATESNYWKLWAGLPVTFGGRIDAIFEDSDHRILCVDWKTTARILDDFDEAAFLELDDQVAGYPVAIRKLGRRVDGFIYHEQRKAVPEKPKRLQREYKGRAFSTDRNAPMEYETFINTIMAEDVRGYNMGCYDEYLEFLQGKMAPKFYQRHVIYKTDIQIQNFWNDLINEAKDILGNPRVYPQPSRFSCSSCMYRVPCDGQNRGEDYKYTLESMFTESRL